MSLSFIGVILCFIGSFLGALGDKYVHDSYNIDKNKLFATKKKTMWIIAILLSIIIDPICTVIALYFTSAAVVAPFAEKNNDIFNINDLINIYLQPIIKNNSTTNINSYNELSENYGKKIDQNKSKDLVGKVENNINDYIEEGVTYSNNNENNYLYKFIYNSNNLYNNTFEKSSKYLSLIYSNNIPNNKNEQNNKTINQIYNYKNKKNIVNRLSKKEEYPLSRSKKLRLNHLLKKRQRKCNNEDDKKERYLYHNKFDNNNENIQNKTNLTITLSYIDNIKYYKKNEEIYYENIYTPFYPSQSIVSDYEKNEKNEKICSIYYRICCCTLCGMSGGLVNIFSEHIIIIFSHEKFYIFQYSFTYLITILTLFCLCNQLIFLNVSLSKFSVTSVIPLIMSNIVFLSSLTTIIMQINESKMNLRSILFFSLGVFLVIIGILYLQYNINQILLKYFRERKK
ncbi:hypothetical protein YYC_03776 [Plasmodium yoelii 17X]|uniref:Magnesium transporter n=1 Tax=Plasmodium yoelii 17X TaxID=1323249 RepID=V7PJY0_PLAYE|nr:hypothetical protein YYC_03776 [Plasmodium yoelii 17X]